MAEGRLFVVEGCLIRVTYGMKTVYRAAWWNPPARDVMLCPLHSDSLWQQLYTKH